eukprot:1159997-Pelagomonas_calceolata.AAC.6
MTPRTNALNNIGSYHHDQSNVGCEQRRTLKTNVAAELLAGRSMQRCCRSVGSKQRRTLKTNVAAVGFGGTPQILRVCLVGWGGALVDGMGGSAGC